VGKINANQSCGRIFFSLSVRSIFRRQPTQLRRKKYSETILIMHRYARNQESTYQLPKGSQRMTNTNSVKLIYVVLLTASLILGWNIGYAENHVQDDTDNPAKLQLPFKYALGEQKYQLKCAECHGEWAGGTQQGPPLLHGYYKPSHHSDRAFLRAILNGSAQHHWAFGDMPPVAGATGEDAAQITAFVRWVQRAKGLY
jgi:mono/diheme cytochrome c family protein